MLKKLLLTKFVASTCGGIWGGQLITESFTKKSLAALPAMGRARARIPVSNLHFISFKICLIQSRPAYGAMVISYGRSTYRAAASVIRITKSYVPAMVGVPEITPVEKFKFSPVGNAGDVNGIVH